MPNQLFPLFADWRARPGRSEAWRENKRDNFPSEDMFVREYPEVPADLFKAADELVFTQQSIMMAQIGASGPRGPEALHTYIKYWDIGRMQDATVLTCWDITSAPYQLVHYLRLVRRPYPVIQNTIETVHVQYPGQTYIEDNGAGRSVIENLNTPASGNNVGQASKIKMILSLKIGMERGFVKFTEKQLIQELSGYMWDDKGLVQDSVMAAAGAISKAGVPSEYGSTPISMEAVSTPSRVGAISTTSVGGSRMSGLPGSIRGARMRDTDEGQRAEEYVR